jgi:hypothetical protein
MERIKRKGEVRISPVHQFNVTAKERKERKKGSQGILLSFLRSLRSFAVSTSVINQCLVILLVSG